jgi:hypothetical protein
VLARLLRRYTVHRGMFHSLPAAIIYGEVAINDGQNGEMVAFHGRAGDLSVFTQAALVAREGESLGGTLVHQIKPEGEVAINDFDLVAFHGKIQIGDGPFAEEFRAVFTSEGLVAQEGVKLGDSDTIPVTISEVGGVAINLFGVVAFHGQTVDGINDTNAVFTNEGLIAEEGQTLESTDILSSIDRHGGVAINLWGDVAFHGVTDAIKAVFTQYGPVVKEGDELPDGTIVDEINVSGGVAINFYGDVAFHGRTGEKKAVFTQYGLVAKVGDILDGGTTLSEIWETGGVAINPYDRQVAFHGTVDSTNDAVFVGLAPVPPASE